MNPTLAARRWSFVGWLVVLLAVAWVTRARLGLIATGPDIDTDAFDHAYIARRMFREWRDLSIHWVWLPLWHVCVAGVTRLGGSLDAVRALNVALSALSPLLLTALLLPDSVRAEAPAARALPYLAGAALALWPLSIGVGEFAQPEALFTLLLLATCLAWERRAHLAAGALCALACLLRYEAWVLPIALLALHAFERRGRGAAWAWALPVLAVAVWCVAHAHATGEWLQFMRLNRAFVADAWRAMSLSSGSALRVAHPWAWYPVLLPQQSLGASVALCFVGGGYVVTRAPRSFALGSGAILAFITAVWARRMNLGLPRHFVAITPLYAAALAAGGCALVDLCAARVEPLRRHAASLALGLGVVLLAHVTATFGAREVTILALAHRASLREERAVLPALRASLGPRQRVFCDMPFVEVISGLGPERFIRWKVTDVGNFNLAVEATQRGAAFALSQPARTRHLTRARTVFANDAVSLVRRDRPRVIDHFLRDAPQVP